MRRFAPPAPSRSSLVRLLSAVAVAVGLALTTISAQIPGRNVNMVSGTKFPEGDPFLQRQNEPSIAASTRNPLHLLGGSNDYRTVDIPGLCTPDPITGECIEPETGDAWLGLFKSKDGGQRWTSTLLPGYALGRVGYTHMRTLGYVVSRHGAEMFLARTRRFVHAVDKSLHRYWANGLEIYGLERPIIAADEVIPSSIDETRESREAFPDAHALHWQVARGLTRAADSIGKRLYFPLYVHRGRRTSRSNRVNA